MRTTCILLVLLLPGCSAKRDWRGLIGGEIAVASLAPQGGGNIKVTIVEPRTHPANACPTGGWITAGDGTRYECPLCEVAPDAMPEDENESTQKYRKRRLLFPRRRRIVIPSELDD